jgi:hypothetical protein
MPNGQWPNDFDKFVERLRSEFLGFNLGGMKLLLTGLRRSLWPTEEPSAPQRQPDGATILFRRPYAFES